MNYKINEILTKNDYLYEINVVALNKNGIVVITKHGVSLYLDDGTSIVSNITPCRLFTNKNKLTDNNLSKILTTWKSSGYEGKFYTKKETDKFSG